MLKRCVWILGTMSYSVRVYNFSVLHICAYSMVFMSLYSALVIGENIFTMCIQRVLLAQRGNANIVSLRKYVLGY